MNLFDEFIYSVNDGDQEAAQEQQEDVLAEDQIIEAPCADEQVPSARTEEDVEATEYTEEVADEAVEEIAAEIAEQGDAINDNIDKQALPALEDAELEESSTEDDSEEEQLD